MAHISSIGAGLFSDFSVCVPGVDPTFASLDTQAEFDALFASEIAAVDGIAGTNTFIRVRNVREFPPMGTQPSITNVPVYGQKTSQQIQGQADAPNLEMQLNFVGTDWAKSASLGKLVGNGKLYVMRFSLLNAEPTGAGATKYASLPAGIGSVENSVWYWVGKIEALSVNPQLTDANTATLTLSIQSEFFGAYTVAAA